MKRIVYTTAEHFRNGFELRVRLYAYNCSILGHIVTIGVMVLLGYAIGFVADTYVPM